MGKAREPVAPIPGWQGFEDPNYTPVPDNFFDVLLPLLTDSEIRVLLYIVRRTYGFKKSSDRISLSQIVSGIVTHEGRRLDGGAGISRPGAVEALRRLEARGVILVERQNSASRGNETNIYTLRKAGAPWLSPLTRPGNHVNQPRQPAQPSLVATANPQETAQETEEQEDADSSSLAENAPPYSAYIAGVVLDHAAELGAAARGPAGVAAVLAAWQASGEPEAAFVARLHAARATVRRRQAPGVDRWGLYLAALAEVP